MHLRNQFLPFVKQAQANAVVAQIHDFLCLLLLIELCMLSILNMKLQFCAFSFSLILNLLGFTNNSLNGFFVNPSDGNILRFLSD